MYMSTDDDDDAIMKAADLSMMQLSDSFFPTGMYSMSNGLEAIFYSGKKIKAEELRELVKTYLEYQIGPADCTALGNAYEYASRSNLAKLLEVDRAIFSMKLVQEIEMHPSDLAHSLC